MTTTFISSTELQSMRAFYEQSMGSSIQLQHPDGPVDRYSKIPYGAAVTVQAHIKQEMTQIFNAAGQIVVAATTVKAPFGTGLTAEDRITLPDGSVPPILSVDSHAPSLDWALYERARLGKA